jgi:hypothetical protein
MEMRGKTVTQENYVFSRLRFGGILDRQHWTVLKESLTGRETVLCKTRWPDVNRTKMKGQDPFGVPNLTGTWTQCDGKRK